MGGEDPGLVGQGHELVVQRAVEPAGQVVGRPADRGQQVGPAHVADEQGVAGEHAPGLGAGALEDHDRDRLGGVPRRVADLQLDLAQGEPLAVLQGLGGEVRRGHVAVGDDGAGGGGQLEVTGQEVGVEVGLEDPLDGEAGGLGVGDVLGDVALGIDDDGPAGRLVADQVAVEGQAAQLVLAEEHGHPLGSVRWLGRSGRSGGSVSARSGRGAGGGPARPAATSCGRPAARRERARAASG